MIEEVKKEKMQLDKVPIPEVNSYTEAFKFLIIHYSGDYYIRWGSLEKDMGLQHPDIEKAFKDELKSKNLPIVLEKITADAAFIYQGKKIKFQGGGSLHYENASFELFKSVIESEHPDYDVTEFEL